MSCPSAETELGQVEAPRVAMLATTSLDVSVQEILGTLLACGSLEHIARNWVDLRQASVRSPREFES